MEALALPRAWVDGHARCIRFEDTKSGATTPADRCRSRETDRGAAGPRWLPVGCSPRHVVMATLSAFRKYWSASAQSAQLEGVTVHVLRHSFAATAAEMGFSELTIAGLLGHSVPGITARYAHVPDSALVAAADRVATRIASALDGKVEADVVPFQRATSTQ